MDQSKITDQLMCPVCLEIPKGEIYQCKNGHHICAECCTTIAHCPQCRVPYGSDKIRNRGMESLMDLMKFDCQYSNMGCSLKVSRGELVSHENSCGFKPVYICKLLGYKNCNFTATQIPSLTIGHLKTVHNITVCHGKKLSVVHKSMKDCLGHVNSSSDFGGGEDFAKNLKWEPILWNLDKDSFSPAFLLLCRLHGGKQRPKRCTWTCLYMGDLAQEGSYYQVNFSIQNVFGNGQSSVLNWTNSPTCFKNLEGLLKKPKFSVPTTFLLDYIEYGRGNESSGKVMQVTAEISKTLKGGNDEGFEALSKVDVMPMIIS